MCEHFQLDNGALAIVCGGRVQRKYCTCGRAADFLCDWKVSAKKSGTCDAPICAAHAKQVALGKHLCPAHQLHYAVWKRKHPDAVMPEQKTLFA